MVDASDAARLRAVTSVFERFGRSAEVAHYRALTVILTQTGYYSMRVSEPRLQRAIAGCHYAEIFAGEAATLAEKDAFIARHR